MSSSRYIHLQTLSKSSSKMSGLRDNPNLDRLPEIEQHDECPNCCLDTQEDGQQEPPPRTLLTRPVQLTVANYSTFAFLEICIWVLLPLVYTTPIQLGGLGLDPKSMGVTLAVFGIMKGIVQLTVFDHIIGFLGLRGTFITLLSCLVPSFLLFPIAGIRAQHAGRDIVLWVLVLIQLLCIAGIHMAYGKQRSLPPGQGEGLSKRWFQAVPSCTSQLRPHGVCSVRQTASPKRLGPCSAPLALQSRPRSSHSR